MIYRSRPHLEADHVCGCLRLGRYPLAALHRMADDATDFLARNAAWHEIDRRRQLDGT